MVLVYYPGKAQLRVSNPLSFHEEEEVVSMKVEIQTQVSMYELKRVSNFPSEQKHHTFLLILIFCIFQPQPFCDSLLQGLPNASPGVPDPGWFLT